MIKVVLDANVYISAILKKGSIPDQIFDLAKKDQLKLLISPPIFIEVKTVLGYPKIKNLPRLTPEIIERFLKDLKIIANTVHTGSMQLKVIKDDPSDNKYLECAVEGKADYIISGDKHLKDLKEFQGIKIVDPASFLKIVKNI